MLWVMLNRVLLSESPTARTIRGLAIGTPATLVVAVLAILDSSLLGV